MEKIAVFGGTFNPVHKEHVEIALLAVRELKLDKLFIMPTFISPHKNTIPAPAEDRLNMLKLALADYPVVSVCDYEIEKQGKSYTYLTMEHFRSLYPTAKLYFVVGGDMLKDFKTWRNPERILQVCDLAVFGREDCLVDFDGEEKYFIDTFGKGFVRLSYTGKVYSSTEIRVYNSLGLDIEKYTHPKVAEYVRQNNLYKGDKYSEYIKKVLPEKRRIHTANVVVTALQRAKELGLDTKKVETACILHDCAKYIDYKTVDGFILPEGVPNPVVHSFLGAYVAETVLGVADEEILDAIRYHTSGKPQMTMLGKLVFVADMIEKDRDYVGVEELRKAYEGDFEECFKKCLYEEVVHLLNKKSNIYIETLNAFDYYINNKKEV